MSLPILPVSRRIGSLKVKPQTYYFTGSAVTIAPEKWFVLEVVAKGKRLLVKVNGVTTVDIENSAHSRGSIGLRHIGGWWGVALPQDRDQGAAGC